MKPTRLKNLEISKDIQNSMGSFSMVMVQMLILLNRHGNKNCVFIPFTVDITGTLAYGDYEIYWDANTGKVHKPLLLELSEWVRLIRKCTEEHTRFVILPFPMTFISNTLQLKRHLNILVYDKSTSTLERFEPNGSSTPVYFRPDLLDMELEKIFNIVYSRLYKTITYIKPSNFCPKIGLQMLEQIERNNYNSPMKKGTCSLWSFVYADMRLTYPNKNREEIHNLIVSKIQEDNSDLYKFIVEYLDTVAFTKTLILQGRK